MNMNPTGSGGVRLTPDLIKKSKTLECACGGMLFRPSMVFKKISAILSPSGKEEILPIDVMVCEKCGKINSELLAHDILPAELMDAPKSSIGVGINLAGKG